MNDLRRIYAEELANGPFPIEERSAVGIDGEAHGTLALYLAEIAGLASRGERLSNLSESDRTKYRKVTSQGLFERCPQLKNKISRASTPKLKALLEATERARLLILRALDK